MRLDQNKGCAVLLMGLLATGCTFDKSGFPFSNNNSNSTGNNNNVPLSCGDGALQAGEACDDGNLEPGDGCAAVCVIEAGWTCTGMPSACAPICGDGILLTGIEACDDGNLSPGDGCSTDCTVEHGYQCSGEPSTCTSECGDGMVATGLENCDDGNTNAGDGCHACQVELGWVCFNEPSICNQTCGNNTVNIGEACDDGNNVDCDGCRGDCSALETGCGDGFLCGTEQCDDGNNDNCDNCNSTCTRVDNICGDGVRECTEACEGVDFGGATCDSETGGTLPGGTLACIPGACTINVSGCLPIANCINHAACPQGQQCIGPTCVSVGDTCGDGHTVLSASGTFQHTLVNLTDDYNAGTTGLNCPGMHGVPDTNGKDRVYQIDLAAGDYFSAWVHAQGWSPVLFITDDCTMATCLRARNDAWWQQDEAPERLDYRATAAETIYLVVDGDGSDGAYTLDFIRGSQSDYTPLSDTHEVLFSEVHPDPQSSDANINNDCEWFEIYNAHATMTRNLQGARFTSPFGEYLDIDHPLFLGPQEWMLIARNAEYQANCGVGPVSWSYFNTSFNLYYAASCRIELRSATDALVDHIDYDAGWPFQDGRSMYLCNNQLDRSDNDSSGNWQVTPNTNPYSYTDGTYTNYGTPAESNPGNCN